MSALSQGFSNRPQERSHLCQQQGETEPGHLAKTTQRTSAAQAEADEHTAQPVLASSAAREFGHHSFSLSCCTPELHIRRWCWVRKLEIAGEDTEHIGRVLRPARHTQVEFGHTAMAVGCQEVRQTALQENRQSSVAVVLCKLSSWGVLDQLSCGRIGLHLLGQCPERKIHLGGRIRRCSP